MPPPSCAITTQPFEVVCLRPDPDSTLAEARAAAGLVAARRWQTVVVVTSRSHISRARLLFRRCVPAEISMVATEPPYGLRKKVGATRHEIFGFADAVLRPKAC